MSNQFGEYPSLVKVFQMLAETQGLQFKDEWQNLRVPASLANMVTVASRTAQRLDGHTLGDFLTPDRIDIDLADETDDAIAVMVCGDESVTSLLVAEVNGECLQRVIDEAFVGEIARAIYK